MSLFATPGTTPSTGAGGSPTGRNEKGLVSIVADDRTSAEMLYLLEA